MKENVLLEPDPGISKERLSIEVTTHCNLNCLHCFVHGGRSKRSNLSIDVAKEIIAEGYDTGYRHLHITGGEPLLWEGLFETLDYAFFTGFETVVMNTNGTLLSENVCTRLEDHDGLLISVSLEGSEAFHNYIRGVGSYEVAIQGIEKVLDRGIELVIFTTAAKSLISGLPHFVHGLYERFPTIQYVTLVELIRGKNGAFLLTEELLEPEDFVQMVKTVSLLNALGYKTEVLKDPLVNVASKMLEMPWIPHAYPMNRNGSIIVMANGNINLSHYSSYNFGTYAPGMIQKVLSSDEYQSAVAPDEITCPLCSYAKLCIENGLVQPSELSGGVHSMMPYCKRVLDKISS